jgi:hypothetical protein
MNDLPNIIINKCKCVLFADDTSIIITNSSPIDYKNNITEVFESISDWFEANLLTLNFDKTHYVQFLTKNSSAMKKHTAYDNNQIVKSTNTKFLGLIIDNMLSWKSHVNWLMSKLGSASYGVWAVRLYMSQETLRMICFSYVHSVMTYGIIFWGNSPHSIHIFRLQKRITRITTNSRGRDSCRDLYRKLKILPLQSQYIFSLLLFMAKNREQIKSNSEIHGISTKHNNNSHYPICSLKTFQKGTHYLGIKVFNNLPPSIKNLSHDTKQFRSALKRFLLLNLFYSLEEYFNYNIN